MAQNNQPHRPQPQQLRPTNAQSEPAKAVETVQQAASIQAPVEQPKLEETQRQKTLERHVEYDEIEEQSFTSMAFTSIVCIVVEELVKNRISSRDAIASLRNWIDANPEFSRAEAEHEITRLKGAVETVSQELPRIMLHK